MPYAHKRNVCIPLWKQRVTTRKIVCSFETLVGRKKVDAAQAQVCVFSERAAPFLLLFRFELTENPMARWRAYSELVINPWKPSTQGLLWEIANIMTSFLFVFCIVSFWKLYELSFGEGPQCWHYARRSNSVETGRGLKSLIILCKQVKLLLLAFHLWTERYWTESIIIP